MEAAFRQGVFRLAVGNTGHQQMCRDALRRTYAERQFPRQAGQRFDAAKDLHIMAGDLGQSGWLGNGMHTLAKVHSQVRAVKRQLTATIVLDARVLPDRKRSLAGGVAGNAAVTRGAVLQPGQIERVGGAVGEHLSGIGMGLLQTGARTEHQRGGGRGIQHPVRFGKQPCGGAADNLRTLRGARGSIDCGLRVVRVIAAQVQHHALCDVEFGRLHRHAHGLGCQGGIRAATLGQAGGSFHAVLSL